jgi:hypothetical protein
MNREQLDIAVNALRSAHQAGRPKTINDPIVAHEGVVKVCSCIVIAEALGYDSSQDIAIAEEFSQLAGGDVVAYDGGVYDFLANLGIDSKPIYELNDEFLWSERRERTFAEVADELIKHAEDYLAEAVLTPA